MRTLNRALSVLLALTLAVFRVLVVAEIIRAGLERRGDPLPFESFARSAGPHLGQRPGDHDQCRGGGARPVAAARATGARRPGLLTVATEDPAVQAGVERRTLGRAMAAAAATSTASAGRERGFGAAGSP